MEQLMDYTAPGNSARSITDNLRYLIILEQHDQSEKRDQLIEKALGELQEIKIDSQQDAIQVVKMIAMDLVQHRAKYTRDS